MSTLNQYGVSMSSTEIYAVCPDGTVENLCDVSNARRGAMSTWRYLSVKYLGADIIYDERMDALWKLHKDARLTEAERICLLSTFDDVLVEAAQLPRLCQAFREVAASIEYTNLPQQADAIEAYATEHPEILGVAWNQTSVKSDVLSGHEDDNGEWVPYNVNDNAGHWWLFAALDSRTAVGESVNTNS